MSVADFKNFEFEWLEVLDRMYDVREVVQRLYVYPAVDSYYGGIGLGHSRGARGLEEDLRSGDDSREHAEPGGCHGLGVFGHGRFSYDGEK
jgi:hypothetical protein